MGESYSSKLVFRSTMHYVSQGVEAEASYRDARGWYAFGGVALARVRIEDETMDPPAASRPPNAPAVTASTGVSTPRLLGRVHLSSELTLIGERRTRGAETSPAWLGWNAALYAPDVGGFDITAGVRNLIGIRDLVPAPGDYDRTTDASGTPVEMPILVSRVPGEGRELYVKIGYSY